jgi:hypothetical protein
MQVPGSSSTGPTLRHREIDWNGSPWQEDVFGDNEDMRAVLNAILTLNEALMVRLSLVLFLTTYFRAILDDLLFWSSHWLTTQRAGPTC